MNKMYRSYRVAYRTPDGEVKHITVTAANQQNAINKVSITKGVVATRAYLIKE